MGAGRMGRRWTHALIRGQPWSGTPTRLRLRRMQADANDPLLDGRERGFVIYRDAATQTVRLGNLAVGPAMGGAVTPDLTGIAGGTIIGFIHSHPGSGPYPSGPDRTSLFPFFQNTITSGGGNAALFRL